MLILLGGNFFEPGLEAEERDFVGRTDLRKSLKLFFPGIAMARITSRDQVLPQNLINKKRETF